MSMSKKQISFHKFQRIARNKNSIKVRGLYLSASFSLSKIPAKVDQAISAYILGDFIYIWRKCKKQKGNMIKTCFMRYKLNSDSAIQDWVMPGGKI